ncbi:MAG: di-trans,poly-cis-decaprenylcistransferase [Bacteroidales bacterium]|jgi:undecaprenyl diphosphate synthase|nr:di-trans,poly-cis-decaprenylcistransferase [Bacteroidales bacterium]
MTTETISKVPAHVSLIMDGNGRWAKERGKERVQGHFEGVESVHACVQAAAKAGVKYLSIFAFSEENWNRPEAEVVSLMGLMVKAMAAYIDGMCEEGVRFVVLGNRARLGDELNAIIDSCMERTAHNDRLTFIIFISYSGKWDILQAAKKMALEMEENPERKQEILDMGVNGFDKYLVTAGIPDPDLIVRTSGENRLSNYLLWQGAYSEFLFVDTLWPDFREKEFNDALAEYAKRDRRYGKVK